MFFGNFDEISVIDGQIVIDPYYIPESMTREEAERFRDALSEAIRSLEGDCF